MDNALLLYIKKIIYSLREMESVYVDIDYLKDAVGSIKITVEDIYTGNQISEWVADLESFGTSAATYSDSSRMNVLITNSDAVQNNKIQKILFDWSVANSKPGLFIKTFTNNGGGISWDSITQATQLSNNSTVFSYIIKNSTLWDLIMGNSSTRTEINNNYTVTESIIVSNLTLSHIQQDIVSKRITQTGYGSFTYDTSKYFVVEFNTVSTYISSGTIYNRDGSTISLKNLQLGESKTVKKFGENIKVSLDRGYSASIKVIDFS